MPMPVTLCEDDCTKMTAMKAIPDSYSGALQVPGKGDRCGKCGIGNTESADRQARRAGLPVHTHNSSLVHEEKTLRKRERKE